MPLSNWDALAFNENAESCISVLTHPNGSLISVYKNQLVLENNEYSVLLHLGDGGLIFEDLILAVDKGFHQRAIFFFATYFDEDLDEEMAESDFLGDEINEEMDEVDTATREINFKILAGIACEGYLNNGIEILSNHGIHIPNDLQHYVTVEHCHDNNRGSYYLIEYPDSEGNTQQLEQDITEAEIKNDKNYLGVSNETYQEFLEWLDKTLTELQKIQEDPEEVEFYKKWLFKVRLQEPLRYNQGDAFFSSADDIASIPHSKIGQAKSPMLDLLLGENS